MLDIVKPNFHDKLNVKRIPVLPNGAAHLIQSLANEDISYEELSSLLLHYPVITFRLLALANSAWSSPVTTISSLDEVCSRLGLNVIKSTCIALVVASPFNLSLCPQFDIQKFWASAFLSTNAAHKIALQTQITPKPDPSTARTITLLQCTGLLWLADQLPNEVNQALITANDVDNSQPLNALLDDLIGIDSIHASIYLCKAWELPEQIIDTLTQANSVDPSKDHWETGTIIQLSNALVARIHNPNIPDIAKHLYETLGINIEFIDHLYLELEKQVDSVYEQANALFSF